MKKTRNTKPSKVASDDLRPEYHFDYSKAKPNRFAGRAKEGRVVVVLDPDLAEIFTTSAAVNKALRAIIKALPQPTK